jgi:hypothetical protein
MLNLATVKTQDTQQLACGNDWLALLVTSGGVKLQLKAVLVRKGCGDEAARLIMLRLPVNMLSVTLASHGAPHVSDR